MNYAEAKAVVCLCRVLDGLPFPDGALDDLGYLSDRAAELLDRPVTVPSPVAMNQQFALEVRMERTGWFIDNAAVDNGWVDAEVYLEPSKQRWAMIQSQTVATRVLTRWVTEPQERR